MRFERQTGMMVVALAVVALAGCASNGRPADTPSATRASTQPAVRRSIFIPIEAKRIAYVCDCSGSMMSKFDELRRELCKAVAALKPDQAYNIIWFGSGDHVPALSKDGFLLPTPENLWRTRNFVDKVSATGQTYPSPSLKLAYKLGADAIYLLTDGDFPDNQEVLDLVRKETAVRKVPIHTIAYVDHGAEYERVLQTIARETGGVYRFVSQRDLDGGE